MPQNVEHLVVIYKKRRPHLMGLIYLIFFLIGMRQAENSVIVDKKVIVQFIVKDLILQN